MRIALFVILAALALASCASPADRITEALLKHGVHQRQAKCMGARLADRLDSAQLQRLSELSKLDNPDRVGKLTLDQFLDQLNRSGDPKLVSQVVRAGLSCAI
ncbi:hypothetical protein KX816_07755 [Sphingosinicellaceae bacterium]|nr:hypothetical protein KX816_07755 [Sphingosinicellaceae bacterium]